MSKYTFLLFKILLLTSYFGNSHKALGDGELRAVDPIEIEFKEEIKSNGKKESQN